MTLLTGTDAHGHILHTGKGETFVTQIRRCVLKFCQFDKISTHTLRIRMSKNCDSCSILGIPIFSLITIRTF